MLSSPAFGICKKILNRSEFLKPMFVSSNNLERLMSEIIQRKNDSNEYFHTVAHENIKSTHIRRFHTSTNCSAGHSQWANRKAGKEIQDKKKAHTATNLLKSMMSVIRQTGETNPRNNPKLQKLYDQAKQKNVPKATLDNLMKRISTKSFEVTTVETVLPGNLYIIYELSSTNMSGTVNNFKSIYKQLGGCLEQGCCSHIFKEEGYVDVGIGNEEAEAHVEQYVDKAIEAGAEDVVLEESDGERYIRFICEPTNILQVKGKLEKLGLNVTNYFNDFFPHELINLEEGHQKNLKYLQMKLETNQLLQCIERKFTNFLEEE